VLRLRAVRTMEVNLRVLSLGWLGAGSCRGFCGYCGGSFMVNGKTRRFSLRTRFAIPYRLAEMCCKPITEIIFELIHHRRLDLRFETTCKTFYPMAMAIATAIFLITIPLVLELFKPNHQIATFPIHHSAQASLSTLGSASVIQPLCQRLLLRDKLFV
jgi:hypothetical protein